MKRKGGIQVRQEEQYKEYADRVYKYLMSLSGGNNSLSEELTQETFFRAITHAESFDGRVQMITWLCAIVKNLYISHLRREKRREDCEPEDIPVDTDISGRMEQRDIYKAVHRLPEPYREIVLLKIHTDMSFAEIGEIFGKSETWARVTFFRGKERLREILKGEDIL